MLLVLSWNPLFICKKIKGYIVVQRQESNNSEIKKETYWGKIYKIWKSAEGWRKFYESLKVALYSPTTARATILIPESELTKVFVVTASSFDDAKALFEHSEASRRGFHEED